MPVKIEAAELQRPPQVTNPNKQQTPIKKSYKKQRNNKKDVLSNKKIAGNDPYANQAKKNARPPQKKFILKTQPHQKLSIQPSVPKDDVLVLNCPPTPIIWDAFPKPQIYMGNNLWRQAGSAEFAEGIFIKITGRAIDSNCVPVNSAVIEIWQCDSYGKDINVYENELVYPNADPIGADPNFVGSGSVTTDNLGYYTFYTVVPGKGKDGLPPHINFYVHHQDFRDLETKMFFSNEVNSLTKDMSPLQQRLLLPKKTADTIELSPGITASEYTFDLVLKGKSKYKRY